MIKGLAHLAVAVSDLERAIRRFSDDFGLDFSGREDVESAQTSTAFFPLPATSIELVHPLRDQGPIRKYLDRQGRGGLHHICFESDDIKADVERLRGLGYHFLSEDIQAGAHGSRVIFIHPRSCDGVLVELSQAAAEEPSAGAQDSDGAA